MIGTLRIGGRQNACDGCGARVKTSGTCFGTGGTHELSNEEIEELRGMDFRMRVRGGATMLLCFSCVLKFDGGKRLPLDPTIVTAGS
jgi:hypothetical protein